MSLEDQIHNTGEHFLGSFSPDPDLSERISQRVAGRARQRRQRAAAGLGAGVVVVLGGLVALNVQRPGGPGPAASGAPTSAVAEVPAFVVSTTALASPQVPAPATTLEVRDDDVLPASTQPPPTAAPSEAAELTTVGAQAVASDPGGAVLYTAGAGPESTSGRTLDPVTGEERATFTLGEPTSRPTPKVAAGSYVYSLVRSAPSSGAGTEADLDPCGQLPLSVDSASDGTAVAGAALPLRAAQLTISASGTRAVILAAPCASADDPLSLLAFDPHQPRQAPSALATIALGDPPAILDFSDDGDWLAVVGADGALLFDVAAGTSGDLLPAGCSMLAADRTVGPFTHARVITVVADCSGTVSLLSGQPGAITTVATYDDFGTSLELVLDDAAIADPLAGWAAVTDLASSQTAVLGNGVSFGPFATDGRVAFAPLARSGS